MTADKEQAVEPVSDAELSEQPSGAKLDQQVADESTVPAEAAADSKTGEENAQPAAKKIKAGSEPVAKASISSSTPARVSSLAAKDQLPPTPSPARRRPRPPTKGILKPPPPPAKPTLGGRLRDLASTVVGTGSKLFDPEDVSSGVHGESAAVGSSSSALRSPAAQSLSTAVGGTLNSLSGKLRIGLSGLVAATTAAPGTSSPGPSTPTGSPMPQRTALPDIGTPSTPGQSTQSQPVSERSRQKQPLKRATFLLPTLSITYPISTHGEPCSAKVVEERRKVCLGLRSRRTAADMSDRDVTPRLDVQLDRGGLLDGRQADGAVREGMSGQGRDQEDGHTASTRGELLISD